MERLNRDVGSAELPLEQTPNVFDSIRVDCAVNVMLKVIHDLVDVLIVYGHIRRVLIGVEESAAINVAENRISQRRDIKCFDQSIQRQFAIAVILQTIPTRNPLTPFTGGFLPGIWKSGLAAAKILRVVGSGRARGTSLDLGHLAKVQKKGPTQPKSHGAL